MPVLKSANLSIVRLVTRVSKTHIFIHIDSALVDERNMAYLGMKIKTKSRKRSGPIRLRLSEKK